MTYCDACGYEKCRNCGSCGMGDPCDACDIIAPEVVACDKNIGGFRR